MILLLIVKLIKKQPTKKVIWALLIYFILICSPLVYLPLGQLEGFYPQLSKFGDSQIAMYLGGGSISFNKNTNQFVIHSTFSRSLEAIRLIKLNNLKTFIISGGNPSGIKEGMLGEAESVKKLALEYGLTEEQIVVEDKSLNTYQEANNIKDYLIKHKISKIYLITSALHMPRSVAIFEKQGIKTIPYPVSYISSPSEISWDFSYKNIGYWKQVIHEYVGFVAYKLMGYI